MASSLCGRSSDSGRIVVTTDRSMVLASGQLTSTRLPAGSREVHLQRAVVELAHVRLAAVEQPALARLAIRRLEVVDVEADVVEVRRGHVALEDVQLHISGLEPLDLHVWEVGAGDAPH